MMACLLPLKKYYWTLTVEIRCGCTPWYFSNLIADLRPWPFKRKWRSSRILIAGYVSMEFPLTPLINAIKKRRRLCWCSFEISEPWKGMGASHTYTVDLCDLWSLWHLPKRYLYLSFVDKKIGGYIYTRHMTPGIWIRLAMGDYVIARSTESPSMVAVGSPTVRMFSFLSHVDGRTDGLYISQACY